MGPKQTLNLIKCSIVESCFSGSFPVNLHGFRSKTQIAKESVNSPAWGGSVV